MKLHLEPGNYIVAVSGGVDSVVLLHRLTGLRGLGLTVAHFDHGIRADSDADARFVKSLAASYGLPFVSDTAALGASASEDLARRRRYQFLQTACRAAGASAVVTAHHQDDVLETAIYNIIRGTGRRGLTSLKSTGNIKRPLIHVSKSDIIHYATAHGLEWREDSTNLSTTYARNYIRHNLLPHFSPTDRDKLRDLVTKSHGTNREIDEILSELIGQISDDNGLLRRLFGLLPHAVACEIIATWLRQYKIIEIDAKMLERLVHAAKTFAPPSQVHVSNNLVMIVGKTYLALRPVER